jgi:hypothetical protein
MKINTSAYSLAPAPGFTRQKLDEQIRLEKEIAPMGMGATVIGLFLDTSLSRSADVVFDQLVNDGHDAEAAWLIDHLYHLRKLGNALDKFIDALKKDGVELAMDDAKNVQAYKNDAPIWPRFMADRISEKRRSNNPPVLVTTPICKFQDAARAEILVLEEALRQEQWRLCRPLPPVLNELYGPSLAIREEVKEEYATWWKTLRVWRGEAAPLDKKAWFEELDLMIRSLVPLGLNPLLPGKWKGYWEKEQVAEGDFKEAFNVLAAIVRFVWKQRCEEIRQQKAVEFYRQKHKGLYDDAPVYESGPRKGLRQDFPGQGFMNLIMYDFLQACRMSGIAGEYMPVELYPEASHLANRIVKEVSVECFGPYTVVQEIKVNKEGKRTRGKPIGVTQAPQGCYRMHYGWLEIQPSELLEIEDGVIPGDSLEVGPAAQEFDEVIDD